MIGELNPCRPGCQPAIRKFVQDNEVTATYVANRTGQTFHWSTFNDSKLKGNVLQTITDTNGNVVARWRFGKIQMDIGKELNIIRFKS